MTDAMTTLLADAALLGLLGAILALVNIRMGTRRGAERDARLNRGSDE